MTDQPKRSKNMKPENILVLGGAMAMSAHLIPASHFIPSVRRQQTYYDRMIAEYNLIKEKKSRLSSKKRASIVHEIETLIKEGKIVL